MLNTWKVFSVFYGFQFVKIDSYSPRLIFKVEIPWSLSDSQKGFILS